MSRYMSKSVSVRKDKNHLYLDFLFRGVRCREYLRLKATKEGRRYAERQARFIEQEILDGTFNYADWFPDSKKCEMFGSIERDKKYTFQEVAEQWLKKTDRRLKAKELKYSTYKKYMKGYSLALKAFSKYEISLITKTMIEDYMYDMVDNGVAKKSINNHLTPIRRIFDLAYEEGYLDNNIMDRVKNFRSELPDVEPFNELEVSAILRHVQENHPEFFAMFVVLFHTGMRIGEVLAMKWQNFDEMFGTYYVKEHFTENRLDTPKTKSSKRQVLLTDEALEALKQHKALTFMKSEFIFCNQYGKPWVSSIHINKAIWKPMLRRLGIAYRVIYQCRHTHASLSILAGDNLSVIAERLGHRNVGTLITRYAKYVQSVRKDRPNIGNFLNEFGQENSAYTQNRDTPKIKSLVSKEKKDAEGGTRTPTLAMSTGS